ncbi:dihydrolipoyl dehydrogenase family protein [Dinoroseobacter sp. S375]|uniref:dihydrolipoyl dehydrogenase family protein n=1 Tax=Dinoroseobacter sp. S375 TaxID=3415136 RepID=UPI003C7C5377
MTDITFDAIVIGGGSGGLAFAQKAADLGARVALVEEDRLGGTCVNRGCVPKKILWSAGQHMRAARAAAAVAVAAPSALDFPALVARRDAHIQGLRDNFEDSLDTAGIRLIRGTAEVDGTAVTVAGTTYKAPHVVLAVGTRPAEMDIPGAEALSDSQDALAWSHVPACLTIVGGGYIGCEFAAIFRALGAEVTLVHDGARLLDGFPDALADHVAMTLREAGVTLQLEDTLAAVEQAETGLRYMLDSGTAGLAEKVVAAAGRTPNVDRLGPIAEHLARADSGAIEVDARLATSVEGVYAIGDAADRLPLTPVATADGTTLAEMLFGEGGTLIDLDSVATTTFVYPPASYIGTVPEDASRAAQFRPLSDHILTDAQGPEPELYRIGIDPETQAITGAQIVAEKSEDMIALLAALRTAGAAAPSLDRTVAVHPSFAEEFFGS